MSVTTTVAPPIGEVLLDRCRFLRRISAAAERYYRGYLTEEHKAAAALIRSWMESAGMSARLDAVGNIVGRYEGARPGAPAVALGSHFDTVRDAGAYDGILGVVTAIECVRRLHEAGRRLPFAIEVYGFADEEGVRFETSYFGSRAVSGSIEVDALSARDADGIALAEALRQFGLDPTRIGAATRSPAEIAAYVELHIEQGPVLEAENLAVGTVTSITGQARILTTVTGTAGHAGTVPMTLRRDALAGAATMIATVELVAREARELVATVGRVEVAPGAMNVIPGHVSFSVDIRAADDLKREAAVAQMRARFAEIANERGLTLTEVLHHSFASRACDDGLMQVVDRACASVTGRAFRLPSGAGHDAATMAALCPMAMIFVRCKGGISHNPAESVTVEDAAAGAAALLNTLTLLAERPWP